MIVALILASCCIGSLLAGEQHPDSETGAKTAKRTHKFRSSLMDKLRRVKNTLSPIEKGDTEYHGYPKPEIELDGTPVPKNSLAAFMLTGEYEESEDVTEARRVKDANRKINSAMLSLSDDGHDGGEYRPLPVFDAYTPLNTASFNPR